MFISDANADAINILSNHLTNFQMSFNALTDDLADLNLPECAKG
jgi:hypothetical protein